MLFEKEENIKKLPIGILSSDILKKLQLAEKFEPFANTEKIIFAYYDIYGNITHFHIRDPLAKTKQERFKTLKVKEKAEGIFNVRTLLEHPDPFVFIVEGEFDVITPVLVSDFAIPVIATGSVSSIKAKTIKSILEQDKIPILVPDWDCAGGNTLQELILEIQEDLKNKIYIVPEPPYKEDEDRNAITDFDELFRFKQEDEARKIAAQFSFITLHEYEKT
ncbi:hypothetical protein [Hippea alviniae]|uniref:hypothetical protein n=1 Tax=Hippea alviniae TaxID=1279027 RepID=UPI0003B7323F|nr:hypothetical protein [Hippea alviniae]